SAKHTWPATPRWSRGSAKPARPSCARSSTSHECGERRAGHNPGASPRPTMSQQRFCLAPILDQTEQHCRDFHRQLSRHARLYTEMVTTGALLHGPRERLLRFDEAEHPVALQLGGSEPEELAQAARFGERAGYDEIDLNS